MTEEREQAVQGVSGTPRWVGLAVVVLAALSVLGLGLGWSALNQGKSSEEGLNAQVQSLKQTIQVLNMRLEQAEESNAKIQGDLSVVTDRLKLTQGELGRARKQAKQIREDYSKQLAEVENAVKGELATKASADSVQALSGDVTGVKNDLAVTRQSLQMARGELGTLIARNHEEIEQLRRLGERDYFEFTLVRKGTRQKLGSVTVELRGTNTRKNLFTMALHVDDKRLEKKNRSVNEPIYFYTRGARVPFELVVNEVGKNKVVGYLSVPKGSASSSGS